MFLFIDILFVTIRNPCQSDKSVFEKKLSGETNTDLSDLRGCFARWEVLSSRQPSLLAL